MRDQTSTVVAKSNNTKLGGTACTWQSLRTCFTGCMHYGKSCYTLTYPARYTTDRLTNNQTISALDINTEHADKIRALALQTRRRNAEKIRINVSGDEQHPDTSGLAEACAFYTAKLGKSCWTYTHWITTPRSKWGKSLSVLASIDCATSSGEPLPRLQITKQLKQAKRSGYRGFALTVPSSKMIRQSARYAHNETGLTALTCRHDLDKRVTCRDCDLCEESTMKRGGYQAIVFEMKHAKQ